MFLTYLKEDILIINDQADHLPQLLLNEDESSASQECSSFTITATVTKNITHLPSNQFFRR
jgi:hypothetical protein